MSNNDITAYCICIVIQSQSPISNNDITALDVLLEAVISFLHVTVLLHLECHVCYSMLQCVKVC